VARLLAGSGRYTPVFWFGRDYPARARDLEKCRALGFRALEPNGMPTAEASVSGGASAVSTASPDSPPHVGRQARTLVRRLSPALETRLHRLALYLLEDGLPSFPRHLHRVRRALRLAQEVVARERPAIVVVAEDNVEYATGALLKAGGDAGVARLMVPFTVPNPREPAEAYWDAPGHSQSRPGNRWLARSRPVWSFRHRGRDLVRLPAARALALERAGLAPLRPWFDGDGPVGAIALESDALLEAYLGAGVAAERLVVTGGLAQDALAAARATAPARRKEILAALDLPADKPLVVCAMPPDQTGTRRSPYPSYAALAASWVDALDASGASVLVKLHPRVLDVHALALGRANVRVAFEDTPDLIAIADLFVASVSATIRWAIACGVPVLNFDVYGFAYDDFASAPGVVTVDAPAAFVETLRALVNEAPRRAALAAAQAQAATRWGVLDGHAHERLMALVDRLVEGGQDR
jgi:hypothetical protein